MCFFMIIIRWTFKSNLFLNAVGIFKICSWSFNVNVWIIKFNLLFNIWYCAWEVNNTLIINEYMRCSSIIDVWICKLSLWKVDSVYFLCVSCCTLWTHKDRFLDWTYCYPYYMKNIYTQTLLGCCNQVVPQTT